MKEPWEKREDESAKAYAAFCVYRDTPTKVRKINRENMDKKWALKFKWRDRAEAYDVYLDGIKREAHQEEIKEMRRRHAELAMDMLNKAAMVLATIEPEEVKPGDLSRLVDVATKLERISRGDVGDVVEQRDSEDKQPSPVTFYMPSNGRNPEMEK